MQTKSSWPRLVTEASAEQHQGWGSSTRAFDGLTASRPLTVEEMRGAVAAIRGRAETRASCQCEGLLESAAVRAFVPPWGDGPDRRRVLVLPAHAGAGASTVALAVAEGLVPRTVQLVEYAEPLRSALASASSIELGTAGSWRCGRRSGVGVLRLAQPIGRGEMPPPLPQDGTPDRWLVVDAGERLAGFWLTSPGELRGQAAHVVVATRLTMPALRQTEHVLEAVAGPALVAVLGPSRWPRSVAAACGPRLHEARDRGRVVRMPIDRELATAGLTPEPLPTAVAAAGRALAALLAPEPRAPRRPRHGKSPGRGVTETGR